MDRVELERHIRTLDLYHSGCGTCLDARQAILAEFEFGTNMKAVTTSVNEARVILLFLKQ
jgi:hypothetical protein